MYHKASYIDSLLREVSHRLPQRDIYGKHIYVGMSGGVDSSLSALLLKQLGFSVHGVFARCWNDGSENGCQTDDERDAVQIASKIGIKLDILDLTNDYKEKVFNDFVAQYKAGYTPNPDILCNSQIKFGALYESIAKQDIWFATGHYAKIQKISTHQTGFSNNYDYIGIPTDKKKDQSYYLSDIIDKKLISKTIFPLSNIPKNDVRKLASDLKLPNYDKKDSQGICFIGDIKLKEFITHYIQNRAGKVYDVKMNLIGEHDGIHLYTIGQRHGFKINKYFGHPMYVLEKNATENFLIVGEKEFCQKNIFHVENMKISFGVTKEISEIKNLEVRVRSLGKLYPVRKIEKTLALSSVLMRIETFKPIFALAPGQRAVFYLNGCIIGSGTIAMPRVS